MGIKYQQNYQVPFYESDAFKKMRISSLLAVALQISGEQSTALGRSDVWVFERYGLFWAVIEYELTIHRLPEFNEKITIGMIIGAMLVIVGIIVMMNNKEEKE